MEFKIISNYLIPKPLIRLEYVDLAKLKCQIKQIKNCSLQGYGDADRVPPNFCQ